MTKWHLKENGEPAQCSADTRACPKIENGGLHFNSKEAAIRSSSALNFIKFGDKGSQLTNEQITLLSKNFLTSVYPNGRLYLDETSDPEEIAGTCNDVSEAFSQYLNENSCSSMCLNMQSSGAYGTLLVGKSKVPHAAVLVNNRYVVDLTYRQFDEHSNVPKITKVEDLESQGWLIVETYSV